MKLYRTLLRFVLLCAALWLAACDVAQGPTAGPVLLPPPDAAAGGIRTGANAPQNVASFRRIVAQMEPVVERECRNRAPGLNCDFAIRVLQNPRLPPNAFQTLDETGRPILGFTETLIQDVRNADELAFVLGHEAAHHIAGHLARQRQNAAVGAASLGALAAALGQNADAVRSAQQIGAAVGARSYSKEFELEADRLGTVLTALAGFDPLVGAAYFARIPDPGNRFLGTHPPNAERIRAVEAAARGL